jgi:hypothetical protein
MEERLRFWENNVGTIGTEKEKSNVIRQCVELCPLKDLLAKQRSKYSQKSAERAWAGQAPSGPAGSRTGTFTNIGGK